jgi:hypothetical protein
MHMVRALGRSLLVPLLLAGCGAMSNTLAQDLAWERWKKCDHFNNVALQRIELDGRIWVETRNGNADLAPWQACMQQAAADQASKSSATGATPPAAVAATEPSDPLAAPVWTIGSEWAYQWESPTGKGTYVASVVREAQRDGLDCYVLAIGSRESYYTKAHLAWVGDVEGGAETWRNSPPRPQYSWPLAVGKEWEETVTQATPAQRSTSERTWSWTIEREEPLTLRAGTLKTLKIVARNKKTGALIYEMWYAPAARSYARLREVVRGGVRERELIAYKIIQSASASPRHPGNDAKHLLELKM